MKNNTSDLFKDVPMALNSTNMMDEPNKPILIHEGIFKLYNNDQSLDINGKVWYDWFPNSGTIFHGVVQNSDPESIQHFSALPTFELKIDNFAFGNALITTLIFSDKSEIGGIVHGIAVLKDKTIPVSIIKFTIPNLRAFFGSPVKTDYDDGKIYIGRNSVEFDNNEYLITIDKARNFDSLFEKLQKKGGYIILYNGEIKKKTGHFEHSQLNELVHSFSTFLSLLNGRRCAPHFLQGIHEENVIWTDFTDYHTDQYKTVFSFSQKRSIDGLSELWKEFSKLWDDPNDKDFLISVIHWYVEANSNSGYIEGSIVMIQTALELLYNWLIIEKRKLLIGKDGENISASNKIRLLLAQINVSKPSPDSISNLKSFIDSNNDIADEVEVFVQIRNAIIHSQEEKRKRLTKIPHNVKYEAQQLGLWYIEISILYILKFKGSYHNRLSGKLWAGEGEENVSFNSCFL